MGKSEVRSGRGLLFTFNSLHHMFEKLINADQMDFFNNIIELNEA